MTGMLVIHQSDPMAYDWINHIHNYHIDNDDISNSTLRCQNLCDVSNAFNNMQAALKNDTSPWTKLINLDYSTLFNNFDANDILETLDNIGVDSLDNIGINNVSMHWIKEYIEVKKDLNCSKILLNSSQLLIWICATWGLLVFCIVQAICEYKKFAFFVKLQNMIVVKEDDDPQQ